MASLHTERADSCTIPWVISSNMTESKWKHKLFLLKNKRCSHQEVNRETTTNNNQTRCLKPPENCVIVSPRTAGPDVSPSSQGSSWYLRFNKQHALQWGPCRRQRPCTFVHYQNIWHLHFHKHLQEGNMLLDGLKEMLPQLSPRGGGAWSPRREDTTWGCWTKTLSTWNLQPGYLIFFTIIFPMGVWTRMG